MESESSDLCEEIYCFLNGILDTLDSEEESNKTLALCQSDSCMGELSISCDTEIDEHFRRSLGKDFLLIFSKSSADSISIADSIVEKEPLCIKSSDEKTDLWKDSLTSDSQENLKIESEGKTELQIGSLTSDSQEKLESESKQETDLRGDSPTSDSQENLKNESEEETDLWGDFPMSDSQKKLENEYERETELRRDSPTSDSQEKLKNEFEVETELRGDTPMSDSQEKLENESEGETELQRDSPMSNSQEKLKNESEGETDLQRDSPTSDSQENLKNESERENESQQDFPVLERLENITNGFETEEFVVEVELQSNSSASEPAKTSELSTDDFKVQIELQDDSVESKQQENFKDGPEMEIELQEDSVKSKPHENFKDGPEMEVELQEDSAESKSQENLKDGLEIEIELQEDSAESKSQENLRDGPEMEMELQKNSAESKPQDLKDDPEMEIELQEDSTESKSQENLKDGPIMEMELQKNSTESKPQDLKDDPKMEIELQEDSAESKSQENLNDGLEIEIELQEDSVESKLQENFKDGPEVEIELQEESAESDSQENLKDGLEIEIKLQEDSAESKPHENLKYFPGMEIKLQEDSAKSKPHENLKYFPEMEVELQEDSAESNSQENLKDGLEIEIKLQEDSAESKPHENLKYFPEMEVELQEDSAVSKPEENLKDSPKMKVELQNVSSASEPQKKVEPKVALNKISLLSTELRRRLALKNKLQVEQSKHTLSVASSSSSSVNKAVEQSKHLSAGTSSSSVSQNKSVEQINYLVPVLISAEPQNKTTTPNKDLSPSSLQPLKIVDDTSGVSKEVDQLTSALKTKAFIAKASVLAIKEGTKLYNDIDICYIATKPRQVEKSGQLFDLVRMLNEESFLKEAVPWLAMRKYISTPACRRCGCMKFACFPAYDRLDKYVSKCVDCLMCYDIQRPSFYAQFPKFSMSHILRIVFYWACQIDVRGIEKTTPLSFQNIVAVWREIQAVCSKYIESAEILKNEEPRTGKLDIVEVGFIKLGRKYLIFGAMQRSSGHVRLQALSTTKTLKDFTFLDLLDKWLSPHACIVSDSQIFRAVASVKYFVVASDPKINNQNLNTYKFGFHNLNILNYLKKNVCHLFGAYLTSSLPISVIQAYLDELQWRERYGQQQNTAFWSIMDLLSGKNLSEITSLPLGTSLSDAAHVSLSKAEFSFEIDEITVANKNFDLNKQVPVHSAAALMYYIMFEKISEDTKDNDIGKRLKSDWHENREARFKLNENNIKARLLGGNYFTSPVAWFVQHKCVSAPEKCLKCFNDKFSLACSIKSQAKQAYWICKNGMCDYRVPFPRPKCLSQFTESSFTDLAGTIFYWAIGTDYQKTIFFASLGKENIRKFHLAMQKHCSNVILKKCPKFEANSKEVEVAVCQFDQYFILCAMDIKKNITRMRIIPDTVETSNGDSYTRMNLMHLLNSWSEIVTSDSKPCDKKAIINLNRGGSIMTTVANLNIYKYIKYVLPVLYYDLLTCESYEELQLLLDEVQWRERYGPSPSAAFWNILADIFDEDIDIVEIACDKNERYTGNRNVEVLLKYLFKSTEAKRKLEKIGTKAPSVGLEEASSTLNKYLNGDPCENVNEYYYSWTWLFEKLKKRVEHVFIHKCYFCSAFLCGNFYAMNHLMEHIHEQFQMDLYCDFCFRKFSSPGLLEDHENKVHISQDPNTCLICNEFFDSQTDFHYHMKKLHVKQEMPYFCEICYYRSSFHLDILAHFTEFHFSSPYLICPFCLKVYCEASKKDEIRTTMPYATHLLGHVDGSEKFQCSRCILNYLQCSELEEHQKNDHLPFAMMKANLAVKELGNPTFETNNKKGKLCIENNPSNSPTFLLVPRSPRQSSFVSILPKPSGSSSVFSKEKENSKNIQNTSILNSRKRQYALQTKPLEKTSEATPPKLSKSAALNTVLKSKDNQNIKDVDSKNIQSDQLKQKAHSDQKAAVPSQVKLDTYTILNSSVKESEKQDVQMENMEFSEWTLLASSDQAIVNSTLKPASNSLRLASNKQPVKESEKQDVQMENMEFSEQALLASSDQAIVNSTLKPASNSLRLASNKQPAKETFRVQYNCRLFNCSLPGNARCLECGAKIRKDHFAEQLKCFCKYSTHCIKAFIFHAKKRHSIGANNLKGSAFSSCSLNLRNPVRCVCGFITNRCDKVASHVDSHWKSHISCVLNEDQYSQETEQTHEVSPVIIDTFSLTLSESENSCSQESLGSEIPAQSYSPVAVSTFESNPDRETPIQSYSPMISTTLESTIEVVSSPTITTSTRTEMIFNKSSAITSRGSEGTITLTQPFVSLNSQNNQALLSCGYNNNTLSLPFCGIPAVQDMSNTIYTVPLPNNINYSNILVASNSSVPMLPADISRTPGAVVASNNLSPSVATPQLPKGIYLVTVDKK